MARGVVARAVVGAAGLVLASMPTMAQDQVTYSFSFTEVDAFTNVAIANPNGLIDIGEGARLTLNVSFTPAVGSTTTYPAPPPPGTGTVAGLGSIFFDLYGANNASGTWSFMQQGGGWALGGAGTPNASGSAVSAIQAGQFIAPGQGPNPANPVNTIWSGVWVPAVYSARTVTFSSYSASASGGLHSSILVRFGVDGSGNPLYVGKWVGASWGRVNVPIAVPAPGVGLVACGLALAVGRRRRAYAEPA
ncbi:MAG: hypothetical protein JNM80_14495 [Phycisphaerae bacterium]|nr:hypothetical protein [Phycisphaerae bacterium]